MPGEETVHLAVKRRNAPAIAGNGNRTDETGGAYLAPGAGSPGALPLSRSGEEVEPAGAPLPAD